MKILDTRVYRGPNLYALRKVIRLRVDLGELEDYPTARLPGFADRLLDAIPSLREHTCSYGEPRRLRAPHGGGRGHLAGSRPGARRHRAAVPRRHAGRLRQDARPRSAQRAVSRHLQLRGRRWWVSRRPRSACGSSATCCHRSARRISTATTISRPISRISSASPSAAPSALRPAPWCGRRKSARSPGSASTTAPWCSSATASFSAASRRPSPARPATPPSRSPPTSG